jgi:hypothetical protein
MNEWEMIIRTPGGEYLTVRQLILKMRMLAIRALGRMFRPEENLFAFRIIRTGKGDVLEGVSRRYTAIALMGLLEESEDVIRQVLHGRSITTICHRLVDGVHESQDLGEVSLILWLARLVSQCNVDKIFDHLNILDPLGRDYSTVELSWLLTGLSVRCNEKTDTEAAGLVARKLLQSFNEKSGMFPHRPGWRHTKNYRSHVTCFADLVYPIQALSYYYLLTGDSEALDAASRCAERICFLQGRSGQWWWHYDYRTGKVIEGYPVYAVHQDAMAPMALLAIQDAGGMDYSRWIDRGISWLVNPPETGVSLIDPQADLIWRKVCRHEPNRLSRGLQAAVSRFHASWRMPGIDWLFRPEQIDYESRPYHMGWILCAWPADRVDAMERSIYAHADDETQAEMILSIP